MALSAIMLAWLDHLAEIGAVPGGSMLELGPQDLVTTPAVSAEFLRRRLPAEAAEQAIGRLSGDSPTDRPQVEIYRALGIDTYVSVDFDDARADVQHDLNEPLTLDRRFDVVTNFGTAEHIFEVATVLRSQYRHLAVGGIAMSVIPAFGQINHGFYNLHPTLWTDLVVANNMQVAAFHYVDDIISRSEQLDAAGTCRLDFESLPIKPLDGQFGSFTALVSMNYFRNTGNRMKAAAPGTIPEPVLDACMVALRRTADSPDELRIPQQAIYASRETRDALARLQAVPR